VEGGTVGDGEEADHDAGAGEGQRRGRAPDLVVALAGEGRGDGDGQQRQEVPRLDAEPHRRPVDGEHVHRQHEQADGQEGEGEYLVGPPLGEPRRQDQDDRGDGQGGGEGRHRDVEPAQGRGAQGTGEQRR
jgi:hypothetical protein